MQLTSVAANKFLEWILHKPAAFLLKAFGAEIMQDAASNKWKQTSTYNYQLITVKERSGLGISQGKYF